MKFHVNWEISCIQRQLSVILNWFMMRQFDGGGLPASAGLVVLRGCGKGEHFTAKTVAAQKATA